MNKHLCDYMSTLPHGAHQALAERAGYSVQYLSALKSGTRTMTLNNALQLEELTAGALRAELLAPDIFARLERAGFMRIKNEQ